MPTPADESRSLRTRFAATQADLARRATDRPGGGGRYVGSVYDGGSKPATVPAVYVTRPYSASADPEAEGSMVSASMDAAASVPVVVLGPDVPAVGDVVIAKLIDGYWVAGSGTPGCAGQICFSVTTTTTGSAIIGATVTVHDGPDSTYSVLGTCTTSPYGGCCVPIHEARTYFYSVTKSGGYSTATGTVAATCATNNVAVQLVPPAVRCPLCASDLPDTLYITDPLDGTAVAVTNTGTTGSWVGCRTITAAGVRDASCASPSTRTIAIRYGVACIQSPNPPHLYTLTLSWWSCFASPTLRLMTGGCSPAPAPGGALTNAISGSDNGDGVCSPVHATFTMAFVTGFYDDMRALYGPSANFSLSE